MPGSTDPEFHRLLKFKQCQLNHMHRKIESIEQENASTRKVIQELSEIKAQLELMVKESRNLSSNEAAAVPPPADAREMPQAHQTVDLPPEPHQAFAAQAAVTPTLPAAPPGPGTADQPGRGTISPPSSNPPTTKGRPSPRTRAPPKPRANNGNSGNPAAGAPGNPAPVVEPEIEVKSNAAKPAEAESILANTTEIFDERGTYNEINPKELKVIERAGAGSTATVLKARFRGQLVAVKELKMGGANARFDELVKRGTQREIEVLAKAKHPNLVVCFGVTLVPFSVISEFCSGGTVFDLLHNESTDLLWWQRLKMLTSVALGMEYLHKFKPQIVHRDLKSPNLLLKTKVGSTTDDPVLKVADFGMARMRDKAVWSQMTPTVGTYHWMAPEVQSGTYDEKVDIYSYAIVLYELIYGDLPFYDQAGPCVLRRAIQGVRPDLQKARSSAPAQHGDTLSRLIQSCWAHDSKLRPSFSSILTTLRDCASE